MPSVVVRYSESDIIKIIIEFLENRGLGISQLAIERETGIINGMYSDDLLFLRQLILEGQWDDALEFVQPLNDLEGFDFTAFQFIIYKHKFLELLCIKSDTSSTLSYELTVEELVQCMNKLEQVCPSKEEYNALCLLLTLPKLSEHVMYRDWNPSNARIECFKAINKLVGKYLALDARDKKNKSRCQLAKDDRLIQLLVKGLLYESCVEFCQIKATSTDKNTIKDISLSSLLGTSGLNEADLCLLSWLQAIPNESFAYPFEQKILNLDVMRLEKPTLEASWSEQILMTPVRPNMFPYSAVPKSRMSELMSKSLNLQSENLAYSLVGKDGQKLTNHKLNVLTRSHAGFSLPLCEERKMDASVDKLFESADKIPAKLPANNGTSKAVHISNPKPLLSTVAPTKQGNSSAPFSPPTSPISSRPASVAKITSTPTPTDSKVGFHTESSVESYKDFQQQRKVFESQMADREKRRQLIERELNDSGVNENTRRSTTATAIQSLPKALQPNGSKENQIPTTVPRTFRQRSLSMDRNQTDRSSYDLSPAANNTQRKQWFQKPEENTNKFIKVAQLEDAQAIRAVSFHPDGTVFGLGSNSKYLRLCAFPTDPNCRNTNSEPRIYQKLPKYHKGSIYCMAWSPSGNLLATGSNDKLIKLMHFNIDNPTETGPTVELGIHDGTVRDLMFLGGDSSSGKNMSSVLVSGGAGDCKAYVTDCTSGSVVRKMTGHSGHIYSVFAWGNNMFVTGSQDKTARIWDTRTSMSIDIIPSTSPGSAFAAVSVDSSGRVLSSGHEDGSCLLWDIRGNRTLQSFSSHTDEVRTIRFSPNAYYLLSGSYDQKVILSDLRGDLLRPLPSVVVAEHSDKVIQCRWHPNQLAFVSTSADKSAVCWWLPPI